MTTENKPTKIMVCQYGDFVLAASGLKCEFYWLGHHIEDVEHLPITDERFKNGLQYRLHFTDTTIDVIPGEEIELRWLNAQPANTHTAVDAGLGSPLDALRWISANVTDEPARELLSRLVTDYAILCGNLQELFRDEPATGGKPVDAIAELVKLERDDLKRQLAEAGKREWRVKAQSLRMKILCFQATRLLSDDHAGQPTREEIKRLRDEIMSYATPPPAPDMSALVEAVQPFLDVASDIDEIGWPDEHIVISMPDPDKSVGILGSHLRVSDFLKLAQAALASAKQPSSAPDVRALAEARKWLDVVDSDLEAIEMGMTGDLTHANVATIARANLAKLAAALAEQDGSAK